MPTVSPGGLAFYARIGSLVQQDEANGWVDLIFCDAAMQMLQGLDQIVEDTDTHPGWTTILDPTVCPPAWLPWLAALCGVTLIPNSTVDQQRTTIEQLPPQQRCTDAAIAQAVVPTTTGTQTVVVIGQAGGNAYAIRVRTLPGETPDPAASAAAALTQKAGGIIMTSVVTDSPTLAEYSRLLSAVVVPIASATLADVT